jgi:hypothetical protein
MIEIRRDLYMDEMTGDRSSNFETVTDEIANAIRHCLE